MQAWAVDHPGPVDDGPLQHVRRTAPEPGAGEVLVKVEACGICRTDLHLTEGDLAPKRPGVVPGHQAVGQVVDPGTAAARFHERDLRSVTSNTRRDGEELFRLIARLPVAAHTTIVPFDAVDRALADVAHGRASGSLVAVLGSVGTVEPVRPGER